MPSTALDIVKGTLITADWLKSVNDFTHKHTRSVAQYGATGSMSQIASPYLQEASNEIAVAGGGMLIIPPGKYVVDSAWDILANNIVIWMLEGAQIVLADNAVGDLAYGSIIVAFQRRGLVLLGININGNKANNDINDNYGNGINIYDCQDVWIEKARVYDVPRDGITISDHTRLAADALGNESVWVTNSKVVGAGSTSQTTGGEGIIVVQGTGIHLLNNQCDYNKLRGIEIETLGTTPLYRGIVDVNVVNNFCRWNDYVGIGCNGSQQISLIGNTMKNNVFAGLYINSTVRIDPSDMVVQGNKCINNGKGIAVDNYTELTITGGTTRGNETNVWLKDVSGITLSGVTVSGADKHGIDFTEGTNSDITITGCLVRASNQSAGAFDNIAGNCTYTIVHGCRVTGTSARYGINAAGSGWSINDNLLDLSGSVAAINDTTSGGARIRDNGGYITEARGTATIPSGSTSVVVSHGCSRTPTLGNITLTGGENPTTTVGTMWVSNITSTQFTINCEVDPGASGFDVGWQVIIV